MNRASIGRGLITSGGRYLRRVLSAVTLLFLLWSPVAAAVTNPQSGSNGLEGRISSPPPSKGATITTPVNGASFTSLPITVNGLCPTGLLVELFSNNIFVGSVQCNNGSYSLQIDLFSGKNDLVARVYDQLDQAGPDSNTVTVTYNDNQVSSLGERISLSSPYGRKGADPGSELDWPIILSGGTGPYAFSIDWGDNSPATLQSQAFPGNVTIKHTYKSAGVYRVVVKATDANGQTAYLQLVAVANGKASGAASTGGSNNNTITVVKVIWWPAAVCVPLLAVTFYFGRRSELLSIRHSIEDTQREAQASEAAEEAKEDAKAAKPAEAASTGA